mmetsp:Transcript_61179/g.147331  ORF Transcript_61179/g.147331 Transcript_61179/m.147331 type:complete len:327 (+) Transcript_61179:26-1006(+)
MSSRSRDDELTISRGRAHDLEMTSSEHLQPRRASSSLSLARSLATSGTAVSLTTWQCAENAKASPCFECCSVCRCSMFRPCWVTSSVSWCSRPGLSAAVSHSLAVKSGWVLAKAGGMMVRSEICSPSPSLTYSSPVDIDCRSRTCCFSAALPSPPLMAAVSSENLSLATEAWHMMQNSSPSDSILEVVIEASCSANLWVSCATMPGRSGPRTTMSTWARDGSSRGAGPTTVRVTSSIVSWLTPSKTLMAGTSDEPRMPDRIHVQMSEVEATQGMRAHIGISAKLRVVDGIQIFHKAARSSRMFPMYSLTAPTGSGPSSLVTKSLIM